MSKYAKINRCDHKFQYGTDRNYTCPYRNVEVFESPVEPALYNGDLIAKKKEQLPCRCGKIKGKVQYTTYFADVIDQQ